MANNTTQANIELNIQQASKDRKKFLQETKKDFEQIAAQIGRLKFGPKTGAAAAISGALGGGDQGQEGKGAPGFGGLLKDVGLGVLTRLKDRVVNAFTEDIGGALEDVSKEIEDALRDITLGRARGIRRRLGAQRESLAETQEALGFAVGTGAISAKQAIPFYNAVRNLKDAEAKGAQEIATETAFLRGKQAAQLLEEGATGKVNELTTGGGRSANDQSIEVIREAGKINRRLEKVLRGT